MDLAVHGAATLAAAYLRVSDRAGVVVLGGALRWLGPAHGDRQFYRIAELLLQARYDSWVTPDLDRIPRTALPPGTLAVIFSPLLDPRGLAALTDLRRRGFPLIVVDTLRDEPPAVARPADAGLALRLWRLDRAATRSALRALGVPVLPWTDDAELEQRPRPAPPASRRRPPPGGPLMTRPRVPRLAGVARLSRVPRLGPGPAAGRAGRRPRAAHRGLAAGLGAGLDLPAGRPGRRRGPDRTPVAARPRPRRGRRRCLLRRLHRGGRGPDRRGPVHPVLSARRRRAPGAARPSGCAARRSCWWPG